MVIFIIALLLVAIFARSLVKPFLIISGLIALYMLFGPLGLVIALVILILVWIF